LWSHFYSTEHARSEHVQSCCAFALSRKPIVNIYKSHESFPFQTHLVAHSLNQILIAHLCSGVLVAPKSHPRVKTLRFVTQHSRLHAWVETTCDSLLSVIYNSTMQLFINCFFHSGVYKNSDFDSKDEFEVIDVDSQCYVQEHSDRYGVYL